MVKPMAVEGTTCVREGEGRAAGPVLLRQRAAGACAPRHTLRAASPGQGAAHTAHLDVVHGQAPEQPHHPILRHNGPGYRQRRVAHQRCRRRAPNRSAQALHLCGQCKAARMSGRSCAVCTGDWRCCVPGARGKAAAHVPGTGPPQAEPLARQCAAHSAHGGSAANRTECAQRQRTRPPPPHPPSRLC